MPKSYIVVGWMLGWMLFCTPAWAQTERTTLRAMLALKTPSSQKTYLVTDVGKEGEWRYGPSDKDSPANGGTVLESTNRAVQGRFKRQFAPRTGVHIDWFLDKSMATINGALLEAVKVSERVNFGSKVYVIAPMVLTPDALWSPQRLRLHFQNTTLQAQSGVKVVKILELQDITELTLSGGVFLDGNVKKAQIAQPLNEGGNAFLTIVAPSNRATSRLEIGSLTIQNMPMCGVNIVTHNDEMDEGYRRVLVKAFREVNGYNGLNIQNDGFAVWGFNVKGAHRSVVIDSLYALQDNEPWGDAPIEKSFYTFTFENQVDPQVHKRKDTLYIKNLYAKYPCSLILYTQAVNNVLIDNYVMDGVLRKPAVADEKAYPTMLRKNLSWVGSKHTWTSFKSPKSSFRVKKLRIQNTNKVFMSESSISDITGLWLNKGITGAIFDSVETDVRIKLHGDGYYFGFPNVPDGRHRVGTFISHIPAKRNYVQPLSADLMIDKLHIGRGSGVIFAMGNAKIGSITQDNDSRGIFESRENRFKNTDMLYNGFIVDKCQATDILWRFNWFVNQKQLTDEATVQAGERYEFKNFTGNNYLESHTTFTAANETSSYVTAYRYDGDATIQRNVEQFLQFVEFNWTNVKMKLIDGAPSNFVRRFMPTKYTEKPLLLNLSRKPRPLKGWKMDWKTSMFTQCVIE